MREVAVAKLVYEIAARLAGDRGMEAAGGKSIGQGKDMLLPPADERTVNEEQDRPELAHRGTSL